MDEQVTIKDYLKNIVDELNAQGEKEYEVKCFVYPVEYHNIGTKHDFPVGGDKKSEGVVAITTKDYDVEKMFQGYLCYPEEYPEFYKKGNFILCFGPSESIQKFDSLMQEYIEDIEAYTEFYGLQDKEFSPKALLRKSETTEVASQN